MAGLVPWIFFANSLSSAASSLVTNSNMLKKVYFPRLAVPLSAIGSGLVDLMVSMSLLFAMMPFYNTAPGTRVAWLPIFILLAIVACTGTGLWLAALNVKYRDVRYVLPFFTQFWMFATPIVYPSSLLKEPWRSVYGLNPMAGVVEGFRWCLFGSRSVSPSMLVLSACTSAVILLLGAYYFRRVEREFADVV